MDPKLIAEAKNVSRGLRAVSAFADLIVDIDVNKKAADAALKARTDAEQKLNEMAKAVAEAAEDLSRIRAEQEAARKQASGGIEAMKAEAKAQIDAAKEQAKAGLVKMQADAEAQLATMEDQRKELTAAVDGLRSDVSDLTQMRDDINGQIEALKAKLG